ncbi:MAG TPA: MobF family relaxase [Opitutaceae bacterium]
MITVGVIRNGANYLSHHLRKNDYWTEGEKAVRGEWVGQGAGALGLEGAVTDEPFDALRRNRHPRTGEVLTVRNRKERVAFFDIQLSAPKDLSVLALVGRDDRVRAAFVDAVRTVIAEMERFAAVRERRGEAAGSEQFRLTRNFVGALFLHDSSRDLDPQLHAHVVLANATWDPERQGWMALQPAEMLRASGYLRQVLYRELASRLRELGYEPYGMSGQGFSVRGVEHLRERFSKRARQVQQLADEFAKQKGRRPTKREIEVLVRESRANKLADVSTAEVRARQRAQLSADEANALDDLVRAALGRRAARVSRGNVHAVLEAALRHTYERHSVVREGDVLRAALELHPEFDRWRELRDALAAHPDAVRAEGEMTLRSITREEAATVRRVQDGRNTRFPLGDATRLPAKLTPGQLVAARALLGSKDFLSVLVGDAGTGKTTVLTAIEAAHLAAGGSPFLALAPTTRAREALASSGFADADTVQRFLVSDALQQRAGRRVILVDEAGLLSTQQLDEVTRIARDVRARLLLVGDTKQHYSVQRGDALRNILEHTHTPVVRLSEVLRQRDEADRRFSRMLASGDVAEAFLYAQERGMIHDAGDDHALFAQAAEDYARNLVHGVDTLVVIPFWEEIERFNAHARAALRRVGLLGETEVVREAVKPLSWTAEQKVHWNQYRLGDRLLFVRDTRFMKRGMAAEVIGILPDGLRIRSGKKLTAKITWRQRDTFEVGRLEKLPVAAGDRILIRGRDDDAGFTNGEFRQVSRVDPSNDEIELDDGRRLPPDFKAWTYGHALTAYRAQGSTAEESILVLGDTATRALARRQFYVGNTRYRGTHRIYVSNGEKILERLALPDPGRELGTEFLRRNRLRVDELVSRRRLPRVREHLRRAMWTVAEQWRRTRESMVRRQEA